MHLFKRIEIDLSQAIVGRAAMRSVARGLNWTIINLATADLRARRLGGTEEPASAKVNLDPLMEKYGKTLDQRNAEDEHDRGAAHEAAIREEQGFALGIPPLELGARLKVVRDYFAEELLKKCVRKPNPQDPRGGMYIDPYTVAETIAVTLEGQAKRSYTPNLERIKAQLEAIGVPTVHEDDVARIQQQQAVSGTKFVKENKEEIANIIEQMVCKDANGNDVDTTEADVVFDALPAIYQARMYVDAERGLWYERDRAIGLMLRGHPDGLTNLGLIDGKRKELHADFDWLMTKKPGFRAAIDDAVQQGQRWPALVPLPVAKTVEKKTA